MLFTAIMPVSAAEASISDRPEQSIIDISAEIERAINGETDLELDTSDIASARIINEDGTTEDVDVYVTTRELQIGLLADENAPVYATTVVARGTIKSAPGHNYKECVTGTLTLYWTDNFGPENAFEGLYGTWTYVNNPETGKPPILSNRKVQVHGGGMPVMGPHDWYNKDLTTNTFNIPKGVVQDRWTYYVATSWVTINGGPVLEVKAATSIVQ